MADEGCPSKLTAASLPLGNRSRRPRSDRHSHWRADRERLGGRLQVERGGLQVMVIKADRFTAIGSDVVALADALAILAQQSAVE